MHNVSRKQVRKLIGKSIYAVRRDGSVVTGKLLRLRGNQLIVSSRKRPKGKKVQTKGFGFFLWPLLLFDLLAIGTLGFWGDGYGGYGGYGGCGCGVPTCGGCGYGKYGGYGPNGGYPGGYFNGY